MPYKGNADRKSNLQNRTDGHQAAGLLVDAEHHNGGGCLIRRQQVGASWIDREIARCLSWRSNLSGSRQSPLSGVDLEDRDRVVPAIRGIQELGVRVHGNLC